MSNKTRPASRPVRKRPEPVRGASGLPIWVPVAVLGAVVLAIVIGIVASSQSSDDDSLAFAQVDYIGDRLPPQPDPGVSDGAVGLTAASVRGFDTDGTERRFENGDPRAVMFVAHWCPHCQAELEAIAAWEAAGNAFPSGVEIQTIATWSDRARPNYPPGEWLADNAWTHPTIVDNEDFLLASSFGLGGTPMWIFIEADGTIAARTGSLTPDQLAAQMTALQA